MMYRTGASRLGPPASPRLFKAGAQLLALRVLHFCQQGMYANRGGDRFLLSIWAGLARRGIRRAGILLSVRSKRRREQTSQDDDGQEEQAKRTKSGEQAHD